MFDLIDSWNLVVVVVAGRGAGSSAGAHAGVSWEGAGAGAGAGASSSCNSAEPTTRVVERSPDDVVMHYKPLMCSPQYLPRHNEGVLPFKHIPDDTPAVEPWHDYPQKVSNIKHVRKFLSAPLKWTDEDRLDWEQWFDDINKSEQDFIGELKWDLDALANHALQFRDGTGNEFQEEAAAWEEEMIVERKEGDGGEFIRSQAKSGYTNSDHYKKTTRTATNKRVAKEAEEAKSYANIDKDDFVIVVEKLGHIPKRQRQEMFQGFDDGEMRLPVWLGEAQSDCHEKTLTLRFHCVGTE